VETDAAGAAMGEGAAGAAEEVAADGEWRRMQLLFANGFTP